MKRMYHVVVSALDDAGLNAGVYGVVAPDATAARRTVVDRMYSDGYHGCLIHRVERLTISDAEIVNPAGWTLCYSMR